MRLRAAATSLSRSTSYPGPSGCGPMPAAAIRPPGPDNTKPAASTVTISTTASAYRSYLLEPHQCLMPTPSFQILFRTEHSPRSTPSDALMVMIVPVGYHQAEEVQAWLELGNCSSVWA